jgi:nucleoside-diphosphate-sugar epimerase
MSEPRRLFCFGLGYVGQALAVALTAAGWRVAGTGRELAGPGRDDIALFPFERGRPLAGAALAALRAADHVLSTVPPDGEGDPVLDRHGGDLAALADARWLGYLSTTNVYGDRGGGWVDERTAPSPSGERGRRRLAAEAGWRHLHAAFGRPVHVFRLAGIYGPGRNQLEAVRLGQASRIDKPGQVFSRIHRDDILAVLRASMARPNPGRVYNLADDRPAAPAEVVAHAAELLGLLPPPLLPFERAALSPMARSFYADSKRVANARIKAELGVRLGYPSYREGLAALLTELTAPQAGAPGPRP